CETGTGISGSGLPRYSEQLLALDYRFYRRSDDSELREAGLEVTSIKPLKTRLQWVVVPRGSPHHHARVGRFIFSATSSNFYTQVLGLTTPAGQVKAHDGSVGSDPKYLVRAGWAQGVQLYVPILG